MATGKVKEEYLSIIFAHYFPHPSELKEKLDKKVYNFAQKYRESLETKHKSSLKNKLLFTKFEPNYSQKESITCTTAYDVVKLERWNRFPCKDGIINVDNAIQDLRKVMEIKAIAKRSKGSSVDATLQELLAIERVCNNIDYYKEIHEVIDEIEYDEENV